VNIKEEGPGGSYGLLPQFNPSLGTLNSVTYTGSLNLEAEFFLTEPQSAVTYGGPIDVYLGFAPPSIVGPNLSGTQASNGSQFTIGVPVGVPINLSGSLDVSSYLYGTGEIQVEPVWQVALNVPYEPGPSPAFFGEITFTYTYGVPEPPGLLLASIAAILPLYLIVRRRLTKRAGCV